MNFEYDDCVRLKHDAQGIGDLHVVEDRGQIVVVKAATGPDYPMTFHTDELVKIGEKYWTPERAEALQEWLKNNPQTQGKV